MATRFRSEKLRQFLKTTQGRTYTVAFFTGLLVLVLILVALFPAFSSIFTQLTENGEREQALALIDEKNTTIRTLLSTEQQSRAISVALREVLPDNYDQAQMLREILQVIDETEVVMSGVRFAERETNPRQLRELQNLQGFVDFRIVTITIDGTRSNLELFLRRLESHQRVYNVRNVTTNVLADEDGGMNAITPFRMNIQTEIYFWLTSTNNQ